MRSLGPIVAALVVTATLAGCVVRESEPHQSSPRMPPSSVVVREPNFTIPQLTFPNLTLGRPWELPRLDLNLTPFVPLAPNLTYLHGGGGARCGTAVPAPTDTLVPASAAPGPHNVTFDGRARCVRFDGHAEAVASRLTFTEDSIFGDGALVLYGVTGVWTAANGTIVAIRNETVRLAGGASMTLDAKVALRGSIGYEAGALRSSHFFGGTMEIVRFGGPHVLLYPLAPALVGNATVTNATRDGSPGTLVLSRVTGIDWERGEVAVFVTGFTAAASSVRTIGAPSGWAVRGTPVAGDLTVLGNATLVANATRHVVAARAAQVFAESAPLFATRLDATAVAGTTVIEVERSRPAVAWIAVREASGNALAPKVKARVTSADAGLHAGTTDWWHDPEITLFDAPELLVRGFLVIFTFGLAAEAFRTTDIAAGETRYTALSINATGEAGDFPVVVRIEGSSNPPATVTFTVRVRD